MNHCLDIECIDDVDSGYVRDDRMPSGSCFNKSLVRQLYERISNRHPARSELIAELLLAHWLTGMKPSKQDLLPQLRSDLVPEGLAIQRPDVFHGGGDFLC
jgi:hypothetical protein